MQYNICVSQFPHKAAQQLSNPAKLTLALYE